MTTFTHPRLREIATVLNDVRAELAGVVASAPAEAMVGAPGDDRWSGAQVLQHLGKVEGSTAKFLEGVFAKALADGLHADAATGSVLASLDRFQVSDGTLRPLVAPERLRPDQQPDPAAAWASLVAVRERTYRAYATVDGRALGNVVAPHPIFGPLNAYEWLLFVGKHEHRHLGQLRRTLGEA